MFIVIEGVDGSGKGTQTKRLSAYLTSQGKDVAQFSFPRYQHTRYGKLIGEYLNGQYGDTHIKIASTLFAVDRFETRDELESNLAIRDYVLCDRWCPSNVAYSCAKVPDEEAKDLAVHLDAVDYDIFGQPVPDLIIHLDISIERSAELIAKKAERCYTAQDADVYEADHEFLKKVAINYRSLVKNTTRYRRWITIEMERNGHLLDEDAVFGKILSAIKRVENELGNDRKN
jgi:dTMP kinase